MDLPQPLIRLLNKRTTKVMVLALGVIAGLLLGNFGFGIDAMWLIVPVLLFAPTLKRPKLLFIPLFILGMFFGVWRGGNVKNELNKWNKLNSENATVVGTVKSDAAVGYMHQLEFELKDVRLEKSSEHIDMRGVIDVQGYGVPAIQRGDIIRAKGKVRDGYGSSAAQISFSELEVLARKDSFIENIRKTFFAGVNTALPEPHGSLGLGFLVGLRILLPEKLLDQLSATGLTHIVAVSGYNLTILIRAMRRGFSKYSKFLATAGSVGLMLSFLAVTGISPSIFRAAVVSSLAIASWYYGRNTHPGVLILVSAAITAFIEPIYLWGDIGWYLSFLAFFGVLVISPIITKRIFKTKKPSFLSQLLIETSSAQLMVTPIIALIFSEVSLISIPANLVVLPFIPLAMILTFVAGLGGAVMPSVSGWVSWPAEVLLNTMLEVIGWFSQLPWAAVSISMTAIQMILIYLLLTVITLVAFYKIKRLGLDNKKFNIIE